jgi:hypothetical protein
LALVVVHLSTMSVVLAAQVALLAVRLVSLQLGVAVAVEQVTQQLLAVRVVEVVTGQYVVEVAIHQDKVFPVA